MRRALADGFELDDDRARVDVAELHDFLSTQAYWALGRSRELIERLVREASRVVALHAPDGSLAGFARTVSDGVSFAYLADVFVRPEHRGHGLGVELVREAIEGAPFAGVRWLLHTEDAHGLYARFGFGEPGPMLMERPRREA